MTFTITTSDGPVRYVRGQPLPHVSDQANIKYVWEGHISEEGPRLVCKTLRFRGNDQQWDREIAAIDAINGARQRPSPPPGLDRIATYLHYGQDADDSLYGHIIMEDHGTPAKVVAEELDNEDIDEGTRLNRRTRLVRALLRDGLEAAVALADCGVYSRDLHPYNFLLPEDFDWDDPAADPQLTICDFSHSYFNNGPIDGTDNTTRGMHCVRPPGLLKDFGAGGRKHDGLVDEAFSVAAAAYVTATGTAPYRLPDGTPVTPNNRAQSISWVLTIDRNLLHEQLNDDDLAYDIADLLNVGQNEQKAKKARKGDLVRVRTRLSQPRIAPPPHEPPSEDSSEAADVLRGRPPVPTTPPDTGIPVQNSSRLALPNYIATTEADLAPIVHPPSPPPLSARIMDHAGPLRPRLRRAIDWAVPGCIAVAVTLLLWAKGFNSWAQSALQALPGSDPAGTAILAFGLGTSIIASVLVMRWARPLGPRAVVAAFAPLLGAVTFGVGLGVAIFHRMLYREISVLPWTAADWGTSQVVILVISLFAVLLLFASWPLISLAKRPLAWTAGAIALAMLTVAGLPVALAGVWDLTGRPEPPCDNPVTLSGPMRSVCFDKDEGWSQRPLTDRPFNTWGPTATLAAANLPCLTAQVIALQSTPGLEPAVDADPVELFGMGPNPVTASLTPMNNNGTRVRRVAGDNIYVMHQGRPEGTEDLLTAYRLISNPENPDASGRHIVEGVGSAGADVVFLERGCATDQRPAINKLQDSLLAAVRAKSLNHVDDFYVAMNKEAAAAAGITTVTVPLHGDAWPYFPKTEQDLIKDELIAEAALNMGEDTRMRVQLVAGQAGAGEPSDLASGWAKTDDSREPDKEFTVIQQYVNNASNDTFFKVYVYHRDEGAIESSRQAVSAILEGIKIDD